MSKKLIISILWTAAIMSAPAQTASVSFDQLANNCQLVIEKNNLKNQKQQELSDLTEVLENYKQMWWDICYAAMDDSTTTKEEIQYLIDNTYADIDNSQLLIDLNEALQGRPVTRPEMPRQPAPDRTKKTDTSRSTPLPQPEQPAKEKRQTDVLSEKVDNHQPEHPEPAKLNPTEKVNEPDTTVKEEKMEEKTTLRPDELVKQRKKQNRN